MTNDSMIHDRFKIIEWALDERMRRLYAATEARVLGRGGVTQVAQATGVSRRAIHFGLKELDAQELPISKGKARVRREGGGKKPITETDPAMRDALEQLVDPISRGDPESPLRWTCKSLRTLADELTILGHPVSYPIVGKLLHELKYSLQFNRKTLEGSQHPDRNAQFEYINERVKESIANGNPVISVDTKKKELVGNYKNNGKTWRPEGEPEEVKMHDFVDKELGRAAPYGVYDIKANAGWVSVGSDHDTATFAVETIRRWWYGIGKLVYPLADQLTITADGGGSNSSRSRLWKVELQQLSNKIGIKIRVCHFPPGTSKWNKIEHRLFSYISMQWHGQPLISYEVIVNLIANTRTRTGLNVHAELDTGTYPIGVKVSDEQLASVQIERDAFHGEWNYLIRPHAA